MLTPEEARARVARGAKLLDEKMPDWITRIDVGRLRMDHGCFCIIGQLQGEFIAGCHALRVPPGADAVAHGFLSECGAALIPDDLFTCTCSEEYALLQDAWIAEIAARVVPAARPTVE